MRRHTTRHGPYQHGVSSSGRYVHVLMDPPHQQTALHASTIYPMLFTDEPVNCPICLRRIASRQAVEQYYADARRGEYPIPQDAPQPE